MYVQKCNTVRTGIDAIIIPRGTQYYTFLCMHKMHGTLIDMHNIP